MEKLFKIKVMRKVDDFSPERVKHRLVKTLLHHLMFAQWAASQKKVKLKRMTKVVQFELADPILHERLKNGKIQQVVMEA